MSQSTTLYIPLNNPMDATDNQLFGINDAGEIVGDTATTAYSVTGYDPSPAFTTVSVPGAVRTTLRGLNDLGDRVGFSTDAADNQTGFFEAAGGAPIAVVGPLSPTTRRAVNQLLGINVYRDAVGFSDDAAGIATGSSYNGLSTNSAAFRLVGSTSTTTTGIDAAGDIVGVAVVGGVSESFVRLAASGTETILTGPAGATSVRASGINDVAQVVGSFVDTAGLSEGFVYNVRTGTYTTYAAPLGTGGTTLNGINDLGQTVGSFIDAAGHTEGLVVIPPGTEPKLIVGNGGTDTLVGSAGTDTIVSGTGRNTIFVGGGDVFLRSGSNLVVSGLQVPTIVGSTGADTIFAGNAVLAYAGADRLTSIGGRGVSTVVGGSGSLVAFGGAGGGVVFAGSGPSTVVGDLGPQTVIGGSGSLVEYAGKIASTTLPAANVGATTLIAGSGPTTLILANSYYGNPPSFINNNAIGSRDVAFVDNASLNVSGSGATTVVARNGATVCNRAAVGDNITYSTAGSNVVEAGQGCDTIVSDGGFGSYYAAGLGTQFDFVRQTAEPPGLFATNISIRQGLDKIALLGFGPGEIQHAVATQMYPTSTVPDGSGDPEQIHLSDGTSIQIFGVNHITAADFI